VRVLEMVKTRHAARLPVRVASTHHLIIQRGQATLMPYFIIERNFAEALNPTIEAAEAVNLINDEEDARWLFSFLSVDHRRSYCLYEAPSMEAIRAAAERANIPADVIVELAGRLMPTGIMASAAP
jgi:hypothetical protein